MPSDPRNLATAHSLATELASGARADQRTIVGIAGEPGAGKSTLAREISHDLSRLGVENAVVAMDGFHLSNAVLESLGRRSRKGAPDTFDADGFVSLLRRISRGSTRPIYAPSFDHGVGEPIAASIAVSPHASIILVEGNYLACPEPPWDEVARIVDHLWYVDLDPSVRRARLLGRHISSGKEPDFARTWVDAVDETNAALIRSTIDRAQRSILRF